MPFLHSQVKPQMVRHGHDGPSSPDRRKQNLKPLNQRLWGMLTIQARAKFVKYPSPTASAWVHKKYVQMGGRFSDTAAEAHKQKVLKEQEKVVSRRTSSKKDSKKKAKKK